MSRNCRVGGIMARPNMYKSLPGKKIPEQYDRIRPRKSWKKKVYTIN